MFPETASCNRRYMLAILTSVGVANYLDRQIIGVLVPRIKLEFGLSDTAVGFLGGPAFAVVYGLFGVPMALLADRTSRRNVVAASLALFSAATVLCGFAASFVQLLAARMATAIGEAGTAPAINSMISDMFAPGRRSAAFSIYASAANIGVVLAFFGGGWIVQHYGWRAAFVLAGAPGLLLAVLIVVSVREPARISRRPAPNLAGLTEAASFLCAKPTFRRVALGMGLASAGSYAGLVFAPSFLIRSHQMTPASVGLLLAVLIGTVGLAGTALAGFVADRLGKGDPRSALHVAALGVAIALPGTMIFYLAGDLRLVIAGAALSTFFSAGFLGLSFATVQGIAPVAIRAQAAAFLLLIANIVGPGLGPQIVGLVSDLLKPEFGTEALRYALLLCVVPSTLAVWMFWSAGRSVLEDSIEPYPAA